MRVTHTVTIVAQCPKGGTDTYRLIVSTGRLISVERILAAVAQLTHRPIYQEHLTQKLARVLRAKVRTTGRHSGVLTEVEA